MEEWLPFIERLGLPTVISIILLIFGLKYVLKPLANSHIDLVDSLKKATESNTKNLDKLTELFEQHIEIESRRIMNIESSMKVLGESLERHLKYHERV